MPIAGLAFIGAVCVILTGCISMQQAYESMDWSILLLIFGMLGIGQAMQETGAAQLLVENIVDVIKPYGPVVILAGLYLLTSILTETLTNNAVAVILTPLVISLCESLGLNVRPYLIALMLASSASFATPIGYQTNTYVYMKGNPIIAMPLTNSPAAIRTPSLRLMASANSVTAQAGGQAANGMAPSGIIRIERIRHTSPTSRTESGLTIQTSRGPI